MLLKQQLEAIEKLRYCNKTERSVYIRGTGNGAFLIYNELYNLGIKVDAFVDIVHPERNELLGLPVLLMADVYKKPVDSYFVVCSQMDIHVYFEIRDELEAQGLVERRDFYHFGNLGSSFLRQPEKQILNAPYLITDKSVESMKKRNLQVLNNYYHLRVKPFLPQMQVDYSAEKIVFSRINVIPNLSCSLKCKYCCAGCQYSSHKTFDVKNSIDDFDKMLGVSKVLCAGILGGELFLHPKIGEFFSSFAKMKNIKNCECVEIFTNATVIPSDDVLKAYSEIPIHKFFMISNYSGLNDNNQRFLEQLDKFDVKYEVFSPSNIHTWNHPGDLKARNFEKIDYTPDELKHLRYKCCDFYGGWTVLEGKLYICGYNVYALYPKLNDYVDIRNCPDDELERRLFDYMYERQTYDLCSYCRGTFYGCEQISVAEQL